MRDEIEVKAALNALTTAMLSAQECNCAPCNIIQDVLAPAMSALMFARGTVPYDLMHVALITALRSVLAKAEIKTKCENAATFEQAARERN